MKANVRATMRIPPDIADWLRGEAKRQNRSLNRQLTECLRAVMAASKNEQA
jgi:predicted HicB family RNase H-like nuclease